MRLKLSVLFMVLLGSVFAVQAQKIGDITFNKLPQDFQLVPRELTNLAAVPVSGAVTNPAVTGVSIRVLRNGALFAYAKPALSASKFSSSFSIRAELAEYDVEVYAFKGVDSSLVVRRKSVVAGDVYYVSGQSNAWIGPIDDLVYQGPWVGWFRPMIIMGRMCWQIHFGRCLWARRGLVRGRLKLRSNYLSRRRFRWHLLIRQQVDRTSTFI